MASAAWTGKSSSSLAENPEQSRSLRILALLPWAQGAYYLLTGLWPIISIRSFQAVTGPKTDHLPTGRESDHWLVMTVAVLVTAVALSLLVAGRRRTVSIETVVLAIGSAIGLTAIDLIYVSRGVIAPIYLVDALIEALLIGAWGIALLTDQINLRRSAPAAS